MIAGALITIREGLEAFLIIGILLGYLVKINQKKLSKYIWVGSIAAVLASVAAAFVIQAFKVNFEGPSALAFEVIVAVIAIVVLSYMIIWMQKQSKNIKGELQAKVDYALSGNQAWGIGILAFVTVIREGLETVLFLSAVEGDGLVVGSLIGLAAAALISALLYKTTVRLDLRKFFLTTGWLLILVAAGLMSHAFYALGELGIVPPIIKGVWSLEAVISNEGLLGKILHAFVGYESTPSLMQVIVYSAYALTIGTIFTKYSKPSPDNKKIHKAV